MVCLHNTKPIKYIPSNHLNMTVYWRFLCTGKAQASNQGNYKHASHVTSPPCKHRNKVHHKTRVGLTCCIMWFRCPFQFSLAPAIVSFVPIQHYFKSTADIQTLYYLVGQSVSHSPLYWTYLPVDPRWIPQVPLQLTDSPCCLNYFGTRWSRARTKESQGR
jgi:hypothetical protein